MKLVDGSLILITIVDVGAGILAVLAWLACCLSCSMVGAFFWRASLGPEVVQHLMQQEHGLQGAAPLPITT